jgi:GTP-binding protein HflX
LFNRLTGAQVLAQDMLFATLDPTMRAILLPQGRKIIASDTVGFISDLPTDLVAAFRATLEEVLEADLILHVRDISHPDTAEQAADVQDILASLGVRTSVPVIEVWNKADLLPADQAAILAQPENRRKNCHLVSAHTGAGVQALLDAIALGFAETKLPAQITLPFSDGRARAWLHDAGVITQEVALENAWDISVLWRDIDAARFASLFPDTPVT